MINSPAPKLMVLGDTRPFASVIAVCKSRTAEVNWDGVGETKLAAKAFPTI